MLTHHHKSVCLLFTSTDLPVWSGLETTGTLDQKGQDQFHLLITEPSVVNRALVGDADGTAAMPAANRLLWLEFSPYRVALTMQGSGQFSYRHQWHRGIYGPSCYWLQTDGAQLNQPLHLRNFTRSLTLDGRPLPTHLRVEYELWSGSMRLGQYVLSLEIRH